MTNKLTPYELLNEQETARILGISVFKLRSDRVKGTGLRFVKLDRCVRYRRDDIESFVQENTFQSTSESQQK